MKKYLKQKSARCRKVLNETNDCGVISTAIVARMTYKAAHALMALYGRPAKRGSYGHDQRMAIQSQGFTVEQVKNDRQKSGSKYTPKTIGEKCKRGYYLCYCNGHVFAVVNGIVEDWTDGRQHHITAIYKIVRTRPTV